MNIGILTVCTGKYDIFFEGLYNSLEKHFLNGHKKTYYVFTDGNIIKADNVNRVEQQQLGWPHDTMMRFHMFNSIEELLQKEDYVYFFNANMLALSDVGEEVFPVEENNFLMGAHHPGFYNKTSGFPYDKNPRCSCYMPSGTFYAQGCFNGGRAKEFLEMSKVLAGNIDKDMENQIIPLWHDESQLNWYYKDRNPLLLSHEYIFPEGWNHLPGKKIMMQIDKSKFGQLRR